MLLTILRHAFALPARSLPLSAPLVASLARTYLLRTGGQHAAHCAAQLRAPASHTPTAHAYRAHTTRRRTRCTPTGFTTARLSMPCCAMPPAHSIGGQAGPLCYRRARAPPRCPRAPTGRGCLQQHGLHRTPLDWNDTADVFSRLLRAAVFILVRAVDKLGSASSFLLHKHAAAARIPFAIALLTAGVA